MNNGNPVNIPDGDRGLGRKLQAGAVVRLDRGLGRSRPVAEKATSREAWQGTLAFVRGNSGAKAADASRGLRG